VVKTGMSDSSVEIVRNGRGRRSQSALRVIGKTERSQKQEKRETISFTQKRSTSRAKNRFLIAMLQADLGDLHG